MYRWTLIVVTLISIGCSATRENSGRREPVINELKKSQIESVIDQNISNNGFFIEKGKISSSSAEGRISLFFNMKYNQKGIYLVSLRSITGMEAFRVYLDSDTVLINDRINKEVLTGNPYAFEKIIGIPYELLIVLTGDIFVGKQVDMAEAPCSAGTSLYSGYLRGLLMNYEIDCERKKISRLILASGIPGKSIIFSYSKFRNDDKRVPRKIEIIDENRSVRISVKIEKISHPWFGNLEFIPGTGYEIKVIR
jgi:hypothetical protein